MSLFERIPEDVRRGRQLDRARRKAVLVALAICAIIAAAWWFEHPFRGPDVLLNVSYDASREYFQEVNAAYLASAHNGERAKVVMSHAGSVQQAQNVARGLVADIVSFASAAEFDEIIRATGCIRRDWQSRFPFGSSPYTSTIVFLVRSGNPKRITGWVDLQRPDVNMSVPDPRVSGAGRYAYLAAWGLALKRHGSDVLSARNDVDAAYMRADLIELGARRALEVFMRRKQADVFLTWESEAIRITTGAHPSGLEVVRPPASILAEPVVAVVDCHVEKRNTRAAATRYVNFLYSPKAQRIAARNGLRPRLGEAQLEFSARFPAMELFSVEEFFGSWDHAWQSHFSPEGSFTQLLELRAARQGGTE